MTIDDRRAVKRVLWIIVFVAVPVVLAWVLT